MNQERTKITVIFDGLCSVCCHFREFVLKRSQNYLFIPFQSIDFNTEFSDIGADRAKEAVYLVYPDREILSSGRAVADILKHLGLFWNLIGFAASLPLIIHLTEWGYRVFASRRNTVAKLLNLDPRREPCG